MLLFNAPEPTTNRRDDMETQDKTTFINVSKAAGVNITAQEITSATRLGKRHDDKSARPLLIKLDKPAKKGPIFKNFSKLANSEYKEISISNDLTKLQREQNKRLRDEAKKLEQEDKSGKYLYRVVGPPWDRRVIKISKDPAPTQEQGKKEEGGKPTK